MSRYTQIHNQIWFDDKFKQLSDSGKLAFLYILSSPHSNMAGCYRLPVAYVVYDLQWEEKKVFETLKELEQSGLIAYDTSSDIVLIKNFLKYNPIQNINQAKGIVRQIKDLPRTFLLVELFQCLKKYASNYLNVFEEIEAIVNELSTSNLATSKICNSAGQDADNLTDSSSDCFETVLKGSGNPSERVSEGFQKGFETVQEGFINPFERVSEGFENRLETHPEPIQNPSPKQKQKQKQKQNNNIDVVTNVTTSRTGSDEHTCGVMSGEHTISSEDTVNSKNQSTANISSFEPSVINPVSVTDGDIFDELFAESEEPADGEDLLAMKNLSGVSSCNEEPDWFEKSADSLDDQDNAVFLKAEPSKFSATCVLTPDSILEAFKRELETPLIPVEPVTQEKLDEMAQILKQNQLECVAKDTFSSHSKEDFTEEEQEIKELTNQKLIARLVGKYRQVTGKKEKDDFPRIGHLYLNFGYAVVEQAIGVFAKKQAQGVTVENPVAFLYSVCRRIKEKINNRDAKRESREGPKYSLITFTPEIVQFMNERGEINDF